MGVVKFTTRFIALPVLAMTFLVSAVGTLSASGVRESTNVPTNGVTIVAAVSTASSPYPATLTMQRGLTFSYVIRSLPWGTTLTAAQERWVTFKSPGRIDRWGVWKEDDGTPEFPVRSTDGGTRWTAAGPLLATDWVGGGLYMVNKAISEGSSAVVMVSNSIIDVSTDSGHQWYQYLNAASDWTMAAYAVHGGGIGLRINLTSTLMPQKTSYAIYVLNVAHHQWHRILQSRAKTIVVVRLPATSVRVSVGDEIRVELRACEASCGYTWRVTCAIRNSGSAIRIDQVQPSIRPAGHCYRT